MLKEFKPKVLSQEQLEDLKKQAIAQAELRVIEARVGATFAIANYEEAIAQYEALLQEKWQPE